jgi:16S rRNA (cytosine1402-N4)-methyltransferase
LKSGGKLAVVTFHSLEDRIVKQFFGENSAKKAHVNKYAKTKTAPGGVFHDVTKKPVIADAKELKRNPRASSAKLRVGVRT